MNTTVLAINPASIKSHQNYCDKKGFGFPILSDPAREVIGAYDCRKTFLKGVTRTVYAIDPDGRIIFAERGQANLQDVMSAIKAAGN